MARVAVVVAVLERVAQVAFERDEVVLDLADVVQAFGDEPP